MSRHLGAADARRATEHVNTGIAATLICGAPIGLVGTLCLDQPCILGGVTPTIFPTRACIGTTLVGAPFIVSSSLPNLRLRFQGEAFCSMLRMVAGALLNAILTPIFILPPGLGIVSSVPATVVSEIVCFLLLMAPGHEAERRGEPQFCDGLSQNLTTGCVEGDCGNLSRC